MELVCTPANPVPEDAFVGAVKTPDGINLRFARWAPPPGRKGTVVVLQGRAEYIEKYFETARDLRARGFAVATFDWRGQGRSERTLKNPRKGHVRSFADYVVDLETVMQQIVLPDCPPPIFALGHSMGGAVAIRACHSGGRWFERVVLSAPMVALTPSRRFMGLAAPLARALRLIGRGSAYIPGGTDAAAGTENFMHNVVTSDPLRYARNAAVLEEAPDLGLGSPTIAWADSALRQIGQFGEAGYAERMRQPMLLVAAGHDEVVSTPAVEALGTNLLAGRHLIIGGSKHEILQEQDRYRDQFWAAFDAFVPGTPVY